MFCKLVIFSFVFFPCFADLSEDQLVRRVHDHLLIQDIASAVKEGKAFVEKYPDSLSIQRAYLEALCRKGEEIEASEQFSIFWRKEEDPSQKRQMSEWLAWGVLGKGEESPLLLVRLYALLGAAFTHDARALPLFLKELKGSNAFLRSLAVKLSASYGDDCLQEELLRLLKEEKVWFVRLEVIRAVGSLRIQKARKILQEIIVNPRTLAEEKASAILSLVNMYEAISKEELNTLLQSNRAGLRHLASEIIGHLDLKEEAPSLLPLLNDDSPDVRISAMNTLGLLRVSTLLEKPTFFYLQKNLGDRNPSISITAAWLALILGEKEGEDQFKKWIEAGDLEAKRLACAALAATGSFGVKLSLQELQKEKDPYARVNLAIGLIGQRKEIPLATQVLFQAFSEAGNDLWMWDEGVSPLFRSLSPSKVRHIDQIPRYPQVVDQFTKLEILSILSLFKYPQALQEVKKFLKKQEFGLTGMAAATLLQEGDETSLMLIKELLTDADEKVRIQAALILAMLGKDPEATAVLIASYPQAGRELKIHILEALGQIGDPSVVLFLLSILKEPFQGLRVVAASALIQCLYH